MRKTLFRRVAVGTFAAAAAIGLSTMFASPASAHKASVSGTATCMSGSWQISWTLSNDHDSPVNLTNFTIDPADAKAKPPTSIASKGTEKFTSSAAGSATSATVSFFAQWSDPNGKWPTEPVKVASDPVKLVGPCVKPSPSPEASSPAPIPSPSPSASASRSAAPSLPVTGSSSTLPMVGTGAALVAGGAGLVFALRRRRRVTFTAE